MKKSDFLNGVKIVSLALVLYLALTYVSAWAPPTQPPPQGNVAAPLNVGIVDQSKAAVIYANDFCLRNADGSLSAKCFGLFQHFQDFTYSASRAGSGVFIIPPGVTKIKVQVWGAGGEGGGTAAGFYGRGGGGAGGYAEAVYIGVTPGEEYSYIVGKGGAGGAPCNDSTGNDGGLSSFSGNSRIFITAGGGGGGNASTGGAGGSGTVNFSTFASEALTYSGSNGGTNSYSSTDPRRFLGQNGGSILYSQGGLDPHTSNPGFYEGGYPGAGGAGGAGYAGECSGGNGANGRIVVWW